MLVKKDTIIQSDLITPSEPREGVWDVQIVGKRMVTQRSIRGHSLIEWWDLFQEKVTDNEYFSYYAKMELGHKHSLIHFFNEAIVHSNETGKRVRVIDWAKDFKFGAVNHNHTLLPYSATTDDIVVVRDERGYVEIRHPKTLQLLAAVKGARGVSLREVELRPEALSLVEGVGFGMARFLEFDWKRSKYRSLTLSKINTPLLLPQCIVGSWGPKLRVFDREKGGDASLDGHSSKITTMVKTGDRVVTADLNHKIIVWLPHKKERLFNWKVSHCRSLIAAGDYVVVNKIKKASVYSLKNGQKLTSLKGEVHAAAVDGEALYLARGIQGLTKLIPKNSCNSI